MSPPTIGRRVYFWPSPHVRHPYQVLDWSKPLDAGVIFVHNERLVNLLVTDHLGTSHSVCSVPFVQEDEPKPDGPAYAAWMPYQVQTQKEAVAKGEGQKEIERKLAAERAAAEAKLAQHQAAPTPTKS